MTDRPGSGGTFALGGARLRWEHPSSTPERIERAIALLGDDEHQRWAATGDPGAQRRFALGRLLLRELAAEALDLPVDRIVVSARCERCGGPHGRPRVSARHPDPGMGSPALVASLSSCADAVVAAIVPRSVSGAIGVDVESTSGSAERSAAIDALLTPAGRAGHGRCAAVRRWTRTEAVLKADGRGLTVDPSQVTVRRHAGELLGSVTDAAESYRLLDTGLGRRVVLSLALGPPPAG